MTSGFKTLSFFFASLLVVSCTDIIDVNVPIDAQELALYGFLGAGETIAVTLYRTAGVNEQVAEADLFVTNALVTIEFEGLRDTLDYVSNGRYTWYQRAVAGGHYQIEVEKEGFPTLSAETTIPELPKIEASNEYIGQSTRYETLSDFLITASLDDLPGIHYYRLRLTVPPEQIETNYLDPFFGCNDVLFRPEPVDVGAQSIESPPEVCREVYFADDTFDGQSKTFLIDIEQDTYKLPASMDLLITSMSTDYLEYHKSLGLQRRNTGDPFAEPVALYSNVHNGFGVFSSYASQSASVFFRRPPGAPSFSSTVVVVPTR